MTHELRIAYEGFARVAHECISNDPYPPPNDVKRRDPLTRWLVIDVLVNSPELRSHAVALFEGFAVNDCPKIFEKLQSQEAASANASLAR